MSAWIRSSNGQLNWIHSENKIKGVSVMTDQENRMEAPIHILQTEYDVYLGALAKAVAYRDNLREDLDITIKEVSNLDRDIVQITKALALLEVSK